MTNPAASPPSLDAPAEISGKSNPTAKLARVFNLLSRRDPTLNSTLYEDAEFGGLLRDLYAALRENDDILSTVIERTVHRCSVLAGNMPSGEWDVPYADIKAAAKAEVATKKAGRKPCRVCGLPTEGDTIQFRTEDDYLPQLHVGCVSIEDEYV